MVRFQRWLRKHRGAAEPTVRQYARGAVSLMIALGDDPIGWTASGVRQYFLERTSKCGKGTIEKLITSLRVFLRYLAVQSLCQADLDKAVPAYASILLLLARLGLRAGDVAQLRLADIEWETGTLLVCGKSSKRARWIAAAIPHERVADHGDRNAVLKRNAGNPLTLRCGRLSLPSAASWPLCATRSRVSADS